MIKLLLIAINISLYQIIILTAFDLIKQPIPGIGVQAGFSALQTLRSLVCNNTIAQLTGISFLYCKVDEDFANKKQKC